VSVSLRPGHKVTVGLVGLIRVALGFRSAWPIHALATLFKGFRVAILVLDATHCLEPASGPWGAAGV
jgi:hypothetical protein